MRQDKDLLDVPSGEYRILVFNRIGNICTYSYHFPDRRTYDEEGAAVHTWNRIIDYDDLVFARICFWPHAANYIIEVEERNEVALALT